MGKIDLEPSSERLVISKSLEEALLASLRLESDGRAIDVPRLVRAIVSQDGFGKRSIEVVTRGRPSTSELLSSLRLKQGNTDLAGKINIQGQEISIASDVVSLLNEARDRAKGAICIDTGHVIQAELGRIDSVLKESLGAESSSSVPTGEVLANFIQIARTERKYPREQKSSNQVSIESSSVDGRVIDLLAEAKKGVYGDVFVNPKWTVAIIQSTTSHPVTVIMTEHSEEVAMVMQGLAVELVSHENVYVDIPNVIAPSPSSLIEDPDGSIVAAVRQAKGGLLILPDDPRFLNHKAVRLGIEKKDIRVVSFAGERTWAKVKSSLDRINSHELYLNTPNAETVFSMLKLQKHRLEAIYNSNGGDSFGLTISDEALKEAAKLGYRYASVMDLPSILAARKLLGTAATNLKLAHSGMKRLLSFKINEDKSIDVADIYLALKTVTGIEIQPEDPARFLQMEDELKKQIVGQDEAIKIVSDIVRRSETVLRDPKRPRGVFMFLGPSGVGKTELAKALNEFIFHDQRSYIQLNMSEYQEQHAVARLIGSPPGYVGYEEGGQLTEQVKKQPYSILVVDEIEKAHPKVFDVFLQVFEEGVLTDGKGRNVDFSNTIVILTGNVGSEFFSNVDSLGFDGVRAEVLREVRQVYRPEFLNRIDNIVIFKPLSQDAISTIVDIQVKNLNARLKESGVRIELTPEMHKFLEKTGYDPKYGARPLRRAVEVYVADKLTPKLLSKSFKDGDTIIVDYKGDEVVFMTEEEK